MIHEIEILAKVKMEELERYITNQTNFRESGFKKTSLLTKRFNQFKTNSKCSQQKCECAC